MNKKDRHDSKEQTMHSKSSRSVFDFSSVEDLRETNQDLVPTDKTQPKIPFDKSYIAHAPSRHLFTLNSRCTYFGGFGTSCKDMGGSVENLTGYIRNDKRNLGFGKFSKSSPDLLGAGYQSSDSDDVTVEETCEDFVTQFDAESSLEKEDKHRNEFIAEPKHVDDTKRRLKTKCATRIHNEDRFQLSMNTLQGDNRRQYISFTTEAKNGAAASMFERLGMTDQKETLSLQCSGTNNAGVRLVSEISVSENNDEDKIESFNKGWKTILHSGKAELKKSLENLNTLRQDVNSREIYDVDSTFESKRFVSDESIELYESTGDEIILKHTSKDTMDIKDFETGIKRNDEMAEISMDDPLRNEKRQKVSQENVSEVFCQGSSSSCVLTTADYSGMSFAEEKYTTNKVNTDEATITPRDKTTNRNVEKPTASSIITSKNDNLDLRPSKEEHAAVNDQCLSFNAEVFQTKSNDILDSKAAKMDGNNSSSLTQLLCNSTVKKLEGSVPQATDDRNESVDKTLDSEESSQRITLLPSCNISPIPLTVLSNSYHQNIPWQNTREFKKESANDTVQVSEIRQSSVSMTKDVKTTVDHDQSLLNSWLKNPNKNLYEGSFGLLNEGEDNSSQTIEDEKQRTSFENDYNGSLFNSTQEPNNNLLNSTTGTEKAKSDDLPKESPHNSLMKSMTGMFCQLGLKDCPDGRFYSNGQPQYKEHEKSKSEENGQECTETAVNIPKDITKSLLAFNQNQESFEEEESLNSMKAQSSVHKDFNECTDAHKGAKSDDSVNDSEKMKIQQLTLLKSSQKDRTFDECTGDVFTTEEKSIVDEDLLLNIEPDETLRLSDIEKGKQEVDVKHGNTERYIDEAVLSRTEMTADFLLSTPDKDEPTNEKFVDLKMQENYGLIANTADLLTTSMDGRLKLSSANKQEQDFKNTITSNLQINRNKWSHLLIIPHHTMNTSKSLSGVLNILVLDSELLPTSPVRKQTVVTLNFYSREDDEKYPQDKKNDVGPVDIQMNGKKEIFIVDDSNADLVQEPQNEGSNSVDENILQSSPDDNIEVVMDQDNSENHPGQMDNTKLMPNELFNDDHGLETISYPENQDSEVAINNEIQQLIFQTDESNHDVPWSATIASPNPDTVESEYKILRASYSTIQQQVYNVDSQTADIKITGDGKNIDGKTVIGKNKSLHIPKQCEVAEQLHTSKPTTVKPTEMNFNTSKHKELSGGTLLGEGHQYRTTMDIYQNQNQVNTSYVLFQRFGKQESPKTYFELNYEVDKWKVGETTNTYRDDDQDKTFVVSYATIEQVNHPKVAFPVYLPTIEEDEIYDKAVYDVQAAQVSNESNKKRIEFLQSSPPLPTPLSPPQSPTPPLPPPLSPPQTPPQSPTPRLPTPLSTPHTPPQSPTPQLPPPLSLLQTPPQSPTPPLLQPLSPPQTPPPSPTPRLPTPLSTPQTPPPSPTPRLPTPLSTPQTPPQSPTPRLPPPLSTPQTPPQSPTSTLPLPSPPQTPPKFSASPLPPSLSTPQTPPQSSSLHLLPQILASSPPQLPTTTKSRTLEENKQETNFHNVHYTNEDLNQNTPYPLLQPVKTSYTQEIEQSQNLERIFEAPEEKGPVEKHYSRPQTPPETVKEVLVEIDYNLQQEITQEIQCHVPSPTHAEDIEPHLPAPLEISPEGVSYEHLRTIEIPPPVSESRPPVWSFAQSLFHTDGQSKTFFKVIDNRNKSFQSSTFMYRGERIKVARKVNVFKSYNQNWKQRFDDEQAIVGRVHEDDEEYSEIWDDGNLMPVDNEVMVARDEAVTRSTRAYETATKQHFFTKQEGRNCSWHLSLSGGNGACEISSNNLDAIAVEDDNTLIGSKGFISGQHRWVIQGLGIFCAVGVCYPSAEVGSWYKGTKWVWTTDGLKYSELTGIKRSEFGQWRNEDVLVVSLDCEEQILRIGNTRTNVEATLCGFKGKVYPYFNIYKGSCIRLLETSVE